LRTLIDLFAGCGGLSLGLEKVGFTPVYVNELHPDAMHTYLSNRLHLPVAHNLNQSNDIMNVTRNKNDLTSLATRLNKSFGDIDLVAGGPPCQGFSGIGHRRSFELTKKEMPSNHLYREMAKFVQQVAPKVFIFENVRGLLNSKWTPDGTKGEIWADVLKSFRNIKIKKGSKMLVYEVYWELVYAKDFGIPQNRPRIIMLGVRSDINQFSQTDMKNLFQSQKYKDSAPDPIELLGDLVDSQWTAGGSTLKYPSTYQNEFQEMLRFNPLTKKIAKKGDLITEHDYAKHSSSVLKKFKYMIQHGGKIPISMQTKKFAQRLIPERWEEKGPCITATSLPDDYVHFSQPRVLTVREWARLQTFPDWYQFHGKRTTGGRRRAGDPSLGVWTRDLPKYTQIGNAVPVNVATEIGKIVLKILKG
jgi:DNA (cytosine-5)-methyltransferase 1